MRYPRVLLATLALTVTCAPGAPKPGIGLLVKAEELPAVRKKIAKEPWAGMFAKIRQRADEAMEAWPGQRDRIAPHLGKLLDLSVRHAKVPADETVREAGKVLSEVAQRSMCPAAFVYLITGRRKYADFAYDVLVHMGKVNRWGWFPWSGVHMPQIHSGMYFRNAAFTLDFAWDALTRAQRKAARDIIAAKAVEPYYRIVLFSPAMGLHHLRSKNQGNNVLAGALIACLALGEDYPGAERWRRSYIQTFHWIVTHDIGWAGQGLESGLPGYWSVSMQNLYTAAACLYNATNIDLRVHPAFMEATYYPAYHEATVPPVRKFTMPIDPNFRGPAGIIAGKPIELPHTASGGPWWYEYASRFPQSQAMHFINRTMVTRDRRGRLAFRVHDCHQQGHADVIALLWTQPDLLRPDTASPTALFKTTDRMSMIRSGYGMGQTYLYFNGDVFLSALGEILCTTSGLAWHYKWHGWQKAETGVETEDEPLAPSMVVKDSWHDDRFTFIHAASGPSNIRYYPPPGQSDCYQRYRRRDRDILYVRDEPGGDYFVFVDRVAQDVARWHGWLWQSWNAVHGNARENYGRHRVEADRRVRLERPNADLIIDFLAPRKVAFEVESAPGQPIVSYMYDHNVLTLRALAGGYGRAGGEAGSGGGKIVIPPAAWRGPGRLCRRDEFDPKGPDTAYRLEGNQQIQAPGIGWEVAAALAPDTRYRMKLAYRKRDLGVYENLAWQIDVELLDADGKVLAHDTQPHDPDKPRAYNRPGNFRLTDTRSMTPTTPWVQTAWAHFDVPATGKVARVRGRLSAATWSHPPSKIHAKSVLDLGEIVIEPVGTVRRRKAETFVAVVSPARKGTPGPGIVRREANRADGAVVATIRRKDRPKHHVVLGHGKTVTVAGWGITADLAVLREDTPASLFARGATSISLRGRQILRSDHPLEVSLRVTSDGTVTWAKVKADRPVRLALAGRKRMLKPGQFVAGAGGKLKPDTAGTVLASNAPANQEALAAGLKPILAWCVAQRDAPTRKGLVNLAPGAKVTASATRDPRFGPDHVIDNKTWEYPTAGVLDYTQGDLKTSPSGGYGRGKLALGGKNMSVWPFYVPPTYWLLPYGTPGWIQLELPKDTTVSLVRLLNTSNAGLNDFATMKYRVELRDASGKPIARREGAFGKRFDRPFQQAFRYRKLFASYGETFKGMLEPGIPVPFGDGWHDVAFEPAEARFVRVYIDSFWALGGGLNEAQVYSTPTPR